MFLTIFGAVLLALATSSLFNFGLDYIILSLRRRSLDRSLAALKGNFDTLYTKMDQHRDSVLGDDFDDSFGNKSSTH